MQDPDRRALAQIIAQRIRELRARHNLTQDEVARRIGCHESAVSRWEAASRMPPCTDVLALAELFGVSTDYMFGRKEQPVPPAVALLDQGLLDRLGKAENAAQFDAIVSERMDQTAWLPVPDDAVLVPVDEAMRRARAIVDRFPDSRFADRLFRPRV